MKNRKRNEYLAGFFVIGGVCVLLGVLLWLSSSNYFSKIYGKYTFCSSDNQGALGLTVGGNVYLGDIKVGQIFWISKTADSKKILYHVNITRKNFKLKTDAVAKVNRTSLLQNADLLITSVGTKRAKLATSKTPIKLKGGVFEALNNLSTELNVKDKNSMAHRLKSAINHLDVALKNVQKITKFLTPEMNPRKENTIAGNIKASTANIRTATKYVDTAAKNISIASKDVTQITGNIKKFTDKQIPELLVTMRKISTEILKTSANLNTSSQSIKTLLASNTDNIDTMIDNMTMVSENLNAASKEIRRNPWRLFYKPDKKKQKTVNIYDAARAFSTGANQLNLVVTKLKELKKMDQNDPEVKKQIIEIKTKLMDSFKKFQKVEKVLWEQIDTK